MAKKSIIHKKDLEHLAELSKIKLEEKNEEKLLQDLGNILEHFEELKAVNTENISPMNGGTEISSVFRKDEESGECKASKEKLIQSFPEKDDDYLKIPPIFE